MKSSLEHPALQLSEPIREIVNGPGRSHGAAGFNDAFAASMLF
jgi:hypothetical protein